MDSGCITAINKRRVAIDIGSTMVKVAQMDEFGNLRSQKFFPRDFELGIAEQVGSLISGLDFQTGDDEILVCSSANGGLRVGIVCLTKHFSGAALRNQVLLAGGNPLFLHDFREACGDLRRIDILLVGGGIDCAESPGLAQRLNDFDPDHYNYGALVYAANKYLASAFQRRFPKSAIIDNPLGTSLSNRVGSVFEAVRRAYLDDLVYKEGVNELSGRLAHGIRPTPEVVSRGFLRAVMNKSPVTIIGACLLLDVGGATTDLHFAVELIREDSELKPASGLSVSRFVFTDLGVVASRDTLMMQIQSHPQLYDFLTTVLGDEVRETYRLIREGEYAPTANLLAYACVFLALYRFTQGREPGLPVGDLSALSQIILTGGATQNLDESTAGRLARLFMPEATPHPLIEIDRRYQVWVGGMTYEDNLAVSA